MLTPTEQGSTIYRGATWELALSLWANTEKTKPFSLAGATVELEILTPTPIVLKEGSGLVVVGGKEAKGSEAAEPTTVNAELTPSQTAALPTATPEARYVLSYTVSGKVTWLMRGTLGFEGP